MITIVGDKVKYDGRLWDVLDVDGVYVHLVTDSEGVCVEVTDSDKLAAVSALPRVA